MKMKSKILPIVLLSVLALIGLPAAHARLVVTDAATLRGGCVVHGFDPKEVRLKCGPKKQNWTMAMGDFNVKYGEPKAGMKVGQALTTQGKKSFRRTASAPTPGQHH